jgi:hypothetical protein
VWGGAHSKRSAYNAPKKHIVFVESNNKEKSSKDIKEELINKVNPRTDGQ